MIAIWQTFTNYFLCNDKNIREIGIKKKIPRNKKRTDIKNKFNFKGWNIYGIYSIKNEIRKCYQHISTNVLFIYRFVGCLMFQGYIKHRFSTFTKYFTNVSTMKLL